MLVSATTRRLFIFNQTIRAISESRREESVGALQSFGQRRKGSQWAMSLCERDSSLLRSGMFIARKVMSSSNAVRRSGSQRESLQDAVRSFERRRRVSAFHAIDISP